MVKISKMVEYSILILTYLAKNDNNQTVSAREISIEYSLPLPTVSKILKTLTKEKMIESLQGPKGGYKLLKDSDEINLKMLLQSIEGKSSIINCSLFDNIDYMCDFSNGCPAKNVMQNLDLEINKMFEEITLKKLASIKE